MASHVVVASGDFSIKLPSWGRSFWQDPNDGELFLAYASGDSEVNFVTSADSGITWTAPQFAFPVESYDIHSNFDTEMDRIGNVHCVFRYASSGCYQLLRKKAAGGWAPSGIGPAGFVTAGDTGPAKGFNGMVAVYDTAIGAAFADIAGPFPAARIAAKDASNVVNTWAVTTPFTAYPFLDDISPGNYENAGPSGGFPIFTDAGDQGGPQVTYMVDNTGIAQVSNFFGTWLQARVLPIRGTISPNDPVGNSGYISHLPFGPAMAFARGTAGKLNPIVLPNSFEHSSTFNWDMLTTAAEAFIVDNNGDYFGRVNSAANFSNQISDSTRRDTYGIPFIGTMPSPVFGAPVSGLAAVDISHGDQEKQIKIYFQTRSPAGDQVISRILCDVQNQSGGAATSLTQYTFSDLESSSSGLRSWAPAGIVHTGGSGNIAAWNGFKVVRHPVDPGTGTTKKEIVATVGSGLSPKINNLIIWDFDNSIEATNLLKIPTFSLERTIDSGNNTNFVGISNLVGLTAAEGDNLFDNNTTTAAAVSNGDSITLEFTKVLLFSRLEIAWDHPFSGPAFFEINIDTSLDGVTYKRVHTIEEGQTPGSFVTGAHLIKSSSEFEVPVDSTINDELDAFVGKFVKITFGGAGGGTRDVREIRLYGPHTTAGKIVTAGYSKSFQQSPPLDIGRSVTFGDVKEGELPLGWTTYGDWDWFVRASGDYSKKTGLPSEISPQDGSVESGVFKGASNGNGDGFSVRTAEWMPLNSSGILETNIEVLSTEVDDNGNPGRTIKWDTRYKLFGSGLLLNEPEDDSLRFFVSPIGSGITDGEVSDLHLQAPCFINVCDWFTVNTSVSPGSYTLRWIFKRGSTAASGPFPGDEAVAYIDNVFGTQGITSPSILGFVKARAFETGVINGYVLSEVSGISSINAYTTAQPNGFDSINGYVIGQPNAFETINAYLRGNSEGDIFAYMLGGDGLRSIPTGSVYGYMNVPSGTIASINGYLLPMQAASIYGYLAGNSGLFASISGYLKAADAASEIYGTVNAGATGITQTIYGFVANRVFESVYGFVKAPSGTVSSIYGYLAPQKISNIYGYVRGLSDQTGVINSYVKGAEAAGEIYGFVISSGDPLVPSEQTIYGCIFSNGASEQVLGYMNVLASEQINGYTAGAEFASGSINAFISGVDFVSSNINSFLAGISGAPSGSINGYMVGIVAPNSQIDGYLIGYDPSDDCASHGVPLPALPIFTIPSGNFIN